MKHSAVANANLEMMNTEPPVTSGFPEELDDIIKSKLGEELVDVIFDKLENYELRANDKHGEQMIGGSEVRELPTTIAPEPAHEGPALNQHPRRAHTPDKLPSLTTDMTSAMTDTYQISTPGDSAIVVVTPCTTQDSYEEPGVEEHHGRPGTSTIGCSTASMGRSIISERVSADTHRTSLSNDIPSREPPPDALPPKEPNAKELSLVTPDPRKPVTPTGKIKRGIRARCRKKATEILRPIWLKFKKRVEDVLLDDETLTSRRSTMKSR